MVEKEEKQNNGQVQAEATAGEKNKVAQEHIEKVLQGVAEEMQHAGTISDYMGNMSMGSDSSLESEFVTLDSISQASVQPAVVVKKGVGRGAVLTGRRISRMAATFQGVGQGQ